MRDFRTKAIFHAHCYDCGAMWGQANAHAVAAKHARATGHHTSVEKTIIYSYNAPDEQDPAALAVSDGEE